MTHSERAISSLNRYASDLGKSSCNESSIEGLLSSFLKQPAFSLMDDDKLLRNAKIVALMERNKIKKKVPAGVDWHPNGEDYE